VALREMQEMEVMAAVNAGVSQGDVEAETSNGSRVWQETGQDELEGGRLCRWTVVRGQSADGTTEWEEKFWEVRLPPFPPLPRRVGSGGEPLLLSARLRHTLPLPLPS
jgi:hypothetical protein